MVSYKTKLRQHFYKPVLGFFLWAATFMFYGCKEDGKIAEEISKIPLEIQLVRFDREFANATPAQLPTLKAKYPYLFPEHYPDSIWLAKVKDTLQRELSEEVNNTFGDFKKESQALQSLFQHIAYYFPALKIPKILTLTSDVRYADRVILTDTLLVLGLDNYLGKEHRFYNSIPRYIASELDKKYLISDVADAFAKKIVPYPKDRAFLHRMIYYGKVLYLKDKWLPSFSDAEKIKYTPEALQWARTNEEQIWRYFVEREILYSTNSRLDRQFLTPAPFSRFGLALDYESPARLGQYMGWQIVKTFMKRNQVPLSKLVTLSADEIFKKANYKPQK